MINVKPSKYNFSFSYPKRAGDQEQIVLYNTRTGSMALIDADKFEQYKQFAENGTPVTDEGLLADLKLGGYVVENDYDELAAIKYNLYSTRFSTSSLILTIAPTSDCNFRCIYCYEKDSIKPIVMSEETQDDLIAFVKKFMPFIQTFHVSWYGGEPLLAISIIERLSAAFLELCEENRVEYNASIVTNGYLLTPQIAERLCAMKVISLQITLDGAAEDHDKRRFLKGGLPTFDRIMDNLCAAKEQLPQEVYVRINADRNNVDRVDNVVRVIREKGLAGRVYPYLAMVENRNDTYNDNSCLHTNEFSRCEFDFIQRNNLDFVGRMPRQIGNYCGADRRGSFVVNADGRLYRCWNEMGIDEECIGTLKDGLKNSTTIHTNLLYDATEDPECRDCKLLPVCMGGCPNARKQNPANRCNIMKHGLDSYMRVIPEILERQLDAAAQREK